MNRGAVCALLTIGFLLGVCFMAACGPGEEAAAEEASTFNPTKVAGTGAMSIYIVHDNVPCVVFSDVVAGGGGIGMDCDFSKGDVLRGLR